MKTKINLIILAVVAIALGACKKDKCCDAGPQEDYVAVFKGEAEWKAKTTEAHFYQDSLYFFGHVGEEHLSLHFKFKGPGKYVFTNSQVSYMETIGMDVTSVQYSVDPAAESVLNITEYDDDKKIYSGNFTLNLLRYYRYDALDAYYPKKLVFTKGSFKITLAK